MTQIGKMTATIVACMAAIFSATDARAAIYSNGFEVDTAGWDAFGGSFNATRVASGANGVDSSSGLFHAESSASGSAGNWGGYNYGAGSVPTVFQEYTTSLDIFLNVGGGWANDTRFDYSSAISNSAGFHLRDFVFNAGFYDDGTGPGASTDRFVISAGNNSGRPNSFPKNTGAIAINTTGWYTFEHRFYDNAGVLNVDMNIYDSTNTLVNSWTLGTDGIGGVGGNRYGWFVNNEFSVLAFDNTQLVTADLEAVPEPASLAIWGIGAIGMAFGIKRRRNCSQAA